MHRLLLALALLAPAASAHAGPENADREISYSVVGTELGAAGMFALNFGAHVSSDGGPVLLETLGVLGVGVGSGLAAHYGELDPRVPQAIHGAGWFGLDMFLIGAMIDGRDKAWGVRAGPAAYTLGALGAVGGALLGSRSKDATATTAWLAGPSLGFMAGGLVLGSVLVLAGGIDGDHAPGQFATGAIVGATFGIGIASYFALRGGDSTSVARLPGQPAVDVGAGRMMVSYGGSF